MKLLTAVGPERMKFTQIDQELYDSFRENFPDFNIETVDEESMKNKEGKEKWRNWCERYKEGKNQKIFEEAKAAKEAAAKAAKEASEKAA